MQTDELIERLAGELRPVRRLAPPAVRALRWLTVFAAIVAAVLMRYADWGVFAHRMAMTRVCVECIAIALTGVTAVLAAFMRSVPGRSAWWAALPVAPGLAWLGASGLGCLQNGLSLHGPGGFLGESTHCFVFIVGVSVPLSIAMLAALRRARPIAPLPVATLGMLGVAALAAFVLEFFHPFDVTVIDLTLHVAAMGVVVAVGAGVRRVLA
jgi:hypothetical protein